MHGLRQKKRRNAVASSPTKAILGGWPKNEDTTEKPFEGDRTKLKATYDNGATTDELRF